MIPFAIGLISVGAAFASRNQCHASRFAGATLISAGMLMVASPAFARDETLLARDNSEVACTVSLRGLTRISLKNDRFASVSKLSRGVDAEDFTIVNEPTRGDIYISLPDGYSRSDVSFFGTTSKGFVYKFACRVGGEDAHQVFVENREVLAELVPPERASRTDAAVSLVQAMHAGVALDGFELRQTDLAPVGVGTLKVRMLSEYRGTDLSGRVLRVENTGRTQIELDETVIAPSNAVAVSVAQRLLRPGQVTAAYVVLPTGAAR